jgi:hypothetical protein
MLLTDSQIAKMKSDLSDKKKSKPRKKTQAQIFEQSPIIKKKTGRSTFNRKRRTTND